MVAAEEGSAEWVEQQLDELTRQGRVERMDGGRFRLTEQGEASAVDKMGGPAVLNASTGLTAMIARNGLMGPPDEEFTEWMKASGFFLIQRVLYLVAHYVGTTDGWRTLVEQIERDELEPSGYFERGMNRAFAGPLRPDDVLDKENA